MVGSTPAHSGLSGDLTELIVGPFSWQTSYHEEMEEDEAPAATEHFQTSFSVRRLDKGWYQPIQLRQVKEHFGNEFFGHVNLNTRHFDGFECWGVKPVRFSGVPVAIVTFNRANRGYIPPQPDLAWRWGRPWLTAFITRPEVFSEECLVDVEDLANRIKGELINWEALPETARLRDWVILWTIENFVVKTFSTPH